MSDVIDDDLMRELGLDDEAVSPVKPTAAATASSLSLDDPFEDEVKPAQSPAPRPQTPPKTAAVTPTKAAPKPTMTDFNESLAKDVPVQLAAVLAKKTLGLGQILELRVGEVLELSRKPSDPIDLVANGKLVAKAELVMIDGQVGVRILKLMR